MRSATYNLAYASKMTASRNTLGQLVQLRHGNNLTTTYTHAPLNFRLGRIQVGSWLTLSYGYDAVGNVKSITDTTNSGQVQTFSYDSLDRLTSASTTSVGNGQYSESYQYNPIGNISSTSRLGNYVYPVAGQPRPHAATAAGSNRYGYDNNGNMITRTEQVSPSLTYTYTQQWDVENRLSVVTNTVTLSVTRFYYDGDGQRVKKVESKSATSTTTVYAGAIEISITGTQRITKTYYTAGAQMVAMRVISSTGSVVYYLHGDHLGSVSLTTDSTGNGITQRYLPYGGIRWSSGTLPTDIGFTGQRLDATGLMFYNARYYASYLNRFLSSDTMVPSSGNPQSLNRYSYSTVVF